MAVKIKKNTTNILPPRNYNKVYIIAALVVGLIFIALYFFKGLVIAAIVNGEPISRLSVIKSLEKQAGKQTLESIVIKALIQQEAKKQNISISKSEIDQEIKKIEAEVSTKGQNLDQLLLLQGLSRNDLIEQIELQKIAGKLVEKDIKITDEEITQYMDKNKDSLTSATEPAKMKEDAKLQIRQQKSNEKLQALIKDLQTKAKINYFVAY